MNIVSHLEPYAPLVLRVGLAFVFMWFGWSGVSNPTIWTGLVPAWTAAIAAPESLVQAHGAFELIFGLLLFAGIGTRIVKSHSYHSPPLLGTDYGARHCHRHSPSLGSADATINRTVARFLVINASKEKNPDFRCRDFMKEREYRLLRKEVLHPLVGNSERLLWRITHILMWMIQDVHDI